MSDLNLKLEKSEIIPLGPLYQTGLVIPMNIRTLKVKTNTFKTLRVCFSCDIPKMNV